MLDRVVMGIERVQNIFHQSEFAFRGLCAAPYRKVENPLFASYSRTQQARPYSPRTPLFRDVRRRAPIVALSRLTPNIFFEMAPDFGCSYSAR